jgi:SNF2 family DNA or RNA helicase
MSNNNNENDNNNVDLDALLDSVGDDVLDDLITDVSPNSSSVPPQLNVTTPSSTNTPRTPSTPLNTFGVFSPMMNTTYQSSPATPIPVSNYPFYNQQQYFALVNAIQQQQRHNGNKMVGAIPIHPLTPYQYRSGFTMMPFQLGATNLYQQQQQIKMMQQQIYMAQQQQQQQQLIQPIYIPNSVKNLTEISGAVGKNWPKLFGQFRAEVVVSNIATWNATAELYNKTPADEQRKKPVYRAFINETLSTAPDHIFVFNPNKEHICNITSQKLNSCLLPLLKKKDLISIQLVDPSSSSRSNRYYMTMKLYMLKKAFDNDPDSLQQKIAAEQNVEDIKESTILDDPLKTSMRNLFDILDANELNDDGLDDRDYVPVGSVRKLDQVYGSNNGNLSKKLRKTESTGDVSDAHFDENLEDVDIDDDLDEYINTEALPTQKSEDEMFKMELQKMYDAMTQQLDKDEEQSDEEEEEGNETSDSGADSDEYGSDSASDWDSDDKLTSSRRKKYQDKKKKKKKKLKIDEVATPEILKAKLRPYQQTALKWMLNREKKGKDAESINIKPQLHPLFQEREFQDESKTKFYYSSDIGVLTLKFIAAPPEPRGGILADEMGLGKTVEIISLICCNRMAPEQQSFAPVYRGDGKDKKYISKATLIVTPLTIVDQWKAEIERHTNPPLKVYIYQGNRRNRDINHLLQYDIIITTYNTLSFEYSNTFLGGESTRKKKKKDAPSKDSPSPIFQIEFFRVVLDEAHNIKNRKSFQARATTAVEANRRWAVTGTPIQNHIDDLFSLFHFLRVNPHGDWRWWSKNIGKPFEKKDKRAAEALQSVIAELVIRRTKDKKINGEHIVQLPPKRINIVELEFSEAENRFYNALYDYAKGKFTEFMESGTLLKNYANILEMLLHLRQVCDHPALIINSFQKKTERSTMKGFLEEFSKQASFEMYDSILPMLPAVIKYNARRDEFRNNQITKYGFVNEEDVPSSFGKINVESYMKQHWRDSSKIAALIDHLKYKVSGTTKSVVFSQWTSMLDLVEIAMQRAGIKYVRLDGRMQRKDREIAVDNFKHDRHVSVCLISLKVGGIGLNLVWATHVFLLDPWWNPAIEQQAIDRVHRIGQEEAVTVIRFVIKGTVEERIMKLQNQKSKIATDALDKSNREFIKEKEALTLTDGEEKKQDYEVEEREEEEASVTSNQLSSTDMDDDDEYISANVETDEDDVEGTLGGFGMTKRDAQNIRLQDMNYLFGIQ